MYMSTLHSHIMIQLYNVLPTMHVIMKSDPVSCIFTVKFPKGMSYHNALRNSTVHVLHRNECLHTYQIHVIHVVYHCEMSLQTPTKKKASNFSLFGNNEPLFPVVALKLRLHSAVQYLHIYHYYNSQVLVTLAPHITRSICSCCCWITSAIELVVSHSASVHVCDTSAM